MPSAEIIARFFIAFRKRSNVFCFLSSDKQIWEFCILFFIFQLLNRDGKGRFLFFLMWLRINIEGQLKVC